MTGAIRLYSFCSRAANVPMGRQPAWPLSHALALYSSIDTVVWGVDFWSGFGDENRAFRAWKSDQKPGFGGEKRAFRAWKPDQKPGFPMRFR